MNWQHVNDRLQLPPPLSQETRQVSSLAFMHQFAMWRTCSWRWHGWQSQIGFCIELSYSGLGDNCTQLQGQQAWARSPSLLGHMHPETYYPTSLACIHALSSNVAYVHLEMAWMVMAKRFPGIEFSYAGLVLSHLTCVRWCAMSSMSQCRTCTWRWRGWQWQSNFPAPSLVVLAWVTAAPNCKNNHHLPPTRSQNLRRILWHTRGGARGHGDGMDGSGRASSRNRA